MNVSHCMFVGHSIKIRKTKKMDKHVTISGFESSSRLK